MYEEMEWEEADIETTRTELTVGQEVFGRVIALAAEDCKRVLKAPGWYALTKREVVEGASAARFFLSDEGKAMAFACGLARTGMLAGVALARATIARIGIDEQLIFADSQEDWIKAIHDATWPPCLRHSPVSGQTFMWFDEAA